MLRAFYMAWDLSNINVLKIDSSYAKIKPLKQMCIIFHAHHNPTLTTS